MTSRRGRQAARGAGIEEGRSSEREEEERVTAREEDVDRDSPTIGKDSSDPSSSQITGPRPMFFFL